MWCNCISVSSIMWHGQHHQQTIAFLRSRWSKWVATWLLGHMTPLETSLALCDSDSVVNGTIPFHWSRQLKWGATSLFGNLMLLTLASVSHDAKTIMHGTIALHRLKNEMKHSMPFLIMWCHWCWHQCPLIPMVSSLHSLGQDDWNEVQHGIFQQWHHWNSCCCNVMPTVMPLPPLHSLGQDNWNNNF